MGISNYLLQFMASMQGHGVGRFLVRNDLSSEFSQISLNFYTGVAINESIPYIDDIIHIFEHVTDIAS